MSGFALGADSIGHRGAVEAAGATTLVMPCGLDRPFPPENRQLFTELLHYPHAAVVSEFPFGTGASSLTLRKRNKLIVALALGVMLSQSSAKGGAMNAYRFAIEQRKPVATFSPDGMERTSGNALIQTGAIDAPGSVGNPQFFDPVFEDRAVFRADGPDVEAWDAWLHRVSSST